MGGNDPSTTHAPIASIEAEQSVLGGLLLDNEGYEVVSEILTLDDFTVGEHRAIYSAIADLLSESSTADTVTVFERLRSTSAKVKEPLRYLNELAQNTPSAANIKHYATIVKNRSRLRGMRTVGRRLVDRAGNTEGREPLELIDQAQAELSRLSDDARSLDVGFLQLKHALTRVVEQVDDRYTNGTADTIGGVATGFIDLDHATDGMHGGELIIVAGRPSMGKTAISMNIAEHVALDQGLPVAVFSMEMPADQLAMRMLASRSGVNHHVLRTGRLRDDDWPRFTHGVASLAEAPIYTIDSSNLTPSRLKSRLRGLQRQLGTKLGLVVVDYLQLMSGDEGSSENRATEIGSISRALKNAAKDLDVPIIALSQLNRGLEQRPNKRPLMSDLRESGSIEQDADVILFIYRDEVYHPDSPDRGTAEVIIGKQRNGPLATIRLAFRSGVTRFENFADPSMER